MPDPFVGLVRVVCAVSLVIVVYVVSSERGGGVVRASGLAAVPEAVSHDASCCLIPANRGLYGGR